jgi:hypothetical protein
MPSLFQTASWDPLFPPDGTYRWQPYTRRLAAWAPVACLAREAGEITPTATPQYIRPDEATPSLGVENLHEQSREPGFPALVHRVAKALRRERRVRWKIANM